MLMGGGEEFQIAVRRGRPCPPCFALTFVRVGRLACEEEYRAERDTITRWLNECGKEELIERRAAFVRWRRKLQACGRKSEPNRHRINNAVPYELVMGASKFLKHALPPSETIGPLSQVELVAFASSLGFDPVSTLSPAHVLRQIWARP